MADKLLLPIAEYFGVGLASQLRIPHQSMADQLPIQSLTEEEKADMIRKYNADRANTDEEEIKHIEEIGQQEGVISATAHIQRRRYERNIFDKTRKKPQSPRFGGSEEEKQQPPEEQKQQPPEEAQVQVGEHVLNDMPNAPEVDRQWPEGGRPIDNDDDDDGDEPPDGQGILDFIDGLPMEQLKKLYSGIMGILSMINQINIPEEEDNKRKDQEVIIQGKKGTYIPTKEEEIVIKGKSNIGYSHWTPEQKQQVEDYQQTAQTIPSHCKRYIRFNKDGQLISYVICSDGLNYTE